MQVIKHITLDLENKGGQEPLYAKQGDDASRFVSITLLKNGVVYAVPEGAAAYFRCRKPDGHSCYNPAAVNMDDGTILVELTAQVLIVPGRVAADVVLEGTEGQVLSSASFEIWVQAAPLGNLADSRDELGRYADQLEQIQTTIEDVQASADEALDQRLRAKTIRVTNFPATEPPTVTVGVVREDDSAAAYVVALDDAGYPAQVTTKHGTDASEDWVCAFSWEGFA